MITQCSSTFNFPTQQKDWKMSTVAYGVVERAPNLDLHPHSITVPSDPRTSVSISKISITTVTSDLERIDELGHTKALCKYKCKPTFKERF